MEITKIRPYQEILILFLSLRKSLKVMPNKKSWDLSNQKFIITHPHKINQKNTDSFEGRYVQIQKKKRIKNYQVKDTSKILDHTYIIW